MILYLLVHGGGGGGIGGGSTQCPLNACASPAPLTPLSFLTPFFRVEGPKPICFAHRSNDSIQSNLIQASSCPSMGDRDGGPASPGSSHCRSDRSRSRGRPPCRSVPLAGSSSSTLQATAQHGDGQRIIQRQRLLQQAPEDNPATPAIPSPGPPCRPRTRPNLYDYLVGVVERHNQLAIALETITNKHTETAHCLNNMVRIMENKPIKYSINPSSSPLTVTVVDVDT